MTTAALKKKIKALVDEKHDAKALRRIHDLLNDPALDGDAEVALRERLDRAENDFRSGRTLSADEARRRLRTSLDVYWSDHS